MLNMDIKHIAYQIVNHALRGKGREKEAIYLNFDLRMSHYSDQGEYNQSRGLHLLYHSLPDSAYINVFSGITDSPFGKIKEVQNWNHECSHDSCWRDINTFSQVYFDMAKKINAARQADGLPEIAPIDMHECNSFGWNGHLYQWVWVEIIKDPTDERSYRKLLTLLDRG